MSGLPTYNSNQTRIFVEPPSPSHPQNFSRIGCRLISFISSVVRKGHNIILISSSHITAILLYFVRKIKQLRDDKSMLLLFLLVVN